MPPIGKADHDIIYVEYDIKAKRIQQDPRKIYLYKRADMEGLRDHLAQFRDSFLSSDHSHMSVNQRTNGPVNAHLRPEIYTCTNKLVRLEWYNACI